MGELKGQAVRGLIEPSELGRTLMHEHVVCDFTPTARRPEAPVEITLKNVWELNYKWVDTPGNRVLLDREVAVREMQRMVRDGGQSVVEVSTYPMVLDPAGLREVSQRTGIHIVRGCGRYLDEFMGPEDRQRSVDDLVADIVADPHYQARDMILQAELPGGTAVKMPGIVPKLSDTPGEVRWQGPALGAHTDSVLAELGLDPARIAALREKGAVA